MAVVENLIPMSERSKDEVREIASRGGVNSGKSRREKKAMREMLEMCLEMKNKKGMTYRQLATMGLINGAIKGSAQNYKTILETLGELNVKDDDENKNGIIDELIGALENAKQDTKGNVKSEAD